MSTGAPLAAAAAAALALTSANPAPSQAPAVTIVARATVLRSQSDPAIVYGSIASSRAGETVTVQAKDCGSPYFRARAGAVTAAGGGWATQFYPRVNTIVRAVWKGAASAEIAIRQRVFVFLDRKRTGDGFRVGVGTLRSFWRKRLLLQARRGGRWRTVRSVLLTDSGPASATGTWVEAEFTLAVPKGTLVRAVLPSSQARPCYLGGVSRTLRT